MNILHVFTLFDVLVFARHYENKLFIRIVFWPAVLRNANGGVRCVRKGRAIYGQGAPSLSYLS